MKKFLILTAALALFSCKKTSETVANSENAKIDSINASRTKYNDSIRTMNNKNRFADISGSHSLKFSSEEANFSGKADFTKTGRDEYSVKGSASSGNNSLNIEGTMKRISEKHLNFDGKISQKINGKSYTRDKKTTFANEGKGNFWRLQDKVNGDGFVDYIDINF